MLTHALEAYVSKNNNAFSDALSEKSIELLIKSLVKCYEEGNNLDSRKMMQEASILAGMSFNIAGLGLNHSIAHQLGATFHIPLAGMSFNIAGLGLNHSIAHQLGATFHIPHGLANAMLLNSVIDYNCKDELILKKYAKLSYKLQFVNIDENPKIAVEILKRIIKTMMISMNMPLRIRDMNISQADYQNSINIMVENTLPKIAVEILKRIIKTMMISMNMPLRIRDMNISQADYQNSINIMVENTLKDRCLPTTPKDISSDDIKEILLQIY